MIFQYPEEYFMSVSGKINTTLEPSLKKIKEERYRKIGQYSYEELLDEIDDEYISSAIK